MAHGSLKDTKSDVRDEESGWSERPLSWYLVQLSSFQMAAQRMWLRGSCSWFPDAVWCQRCSESAEECLLCPRASVDSTQRAFTLTDLWRCRIPGPWVKFSSSPKLSNYFCSAIVACSKILSGRISFTPPSQIPGTEVKCQPVDKLCKNVSGGKLTKTSIPWTVCRIRLHWSINTLYWLYLYTVGTQRCAHTPVGRMRKRETHLGVMDPLPPVGNQWAPAGCVPVSSSWWFLMMKPLWIMIHSWSLSTRCRVQGQTDPLHLRKTRSGLFVVVLWRINLNK